MDLAACDQCQLVHKEGIMKRLFWGLLLIFCTASICEAKSVLDNLSYPNTKQDLIDIVKKYHGWDVKISRVGENESVYSFSTTSSAVFRSNDGKKINDFMFMVIPDPALEGKIRVKHFVSEMVQAIEVSAQLLFPDFENRPDMHKALMETVSLLNRRMGDEIGKKHTIHLTGANVEFVAMLMDSGMYVLLIQRRENSK